MSDVSEALDAFSPRAYRAGLLLALGLPAATALLAFTGIVPPGDHRPDGPLLSLGHTFTGLVFLASTWSLWRRGRTLAAFPRVPEARQAGLVVRETLLCAVLAASSSLYGLIYWALVGRHALRHVVGFMVLTPILFLALATRPGTWRKALEAAD